MDKFPHHLDGIAFLIYSDNKEPAWGAEFTETQAQEKTGKSWG